MTHTYDWSNLDAGWSYEPNTGCGGALRSSDGSAVTLEYLEGWDDCGKFTRDARAQLTKCRVVTNAQSANDYLRNRDQAHDRQRKHEATHGWRNPPCIYEEQT